MCKANESIITKVANLMELRKAIEALQDEAEAITDEINNIFWQAMDSYQTGTITIAYTPVAVLGTQVVAGTNYAVLCRASEINKGRSWVIVYLYRDLEGNASVLKIADVPLGV